MRHDLEVVNEPNSRRVHDHTVLTAAAGRKMKKIKKSSQRFFFLKNSLFFRVGDVSWGAEMK